jgi:hypothetical protein
VTVQRAVLDVAIALPEHAGDTRAVVIAERQVDHRVGAALQRIVAAGQCERAGEIVLRLVAAEVDHAGDGVFAEQRTLRPAQHFDLDPCRTGHRE